MYEKQNYRQFKDSLTHENERSFDRAFCFLMGQKQDSLNESSLRGLKKLLK